MAKCPALKALENANEESGFQASVVMYFFMNNLWKFGESFFVLQFCSATIRPWETEFCNRNQKLTPALRPAWRAVWAVLCELCALCCSTWYLACVAIFYPYSHDCLLWILMLGSWVLISERPLNIQGLHFKTEHLTLAWTHCSLLFSMVLWLDFHHSSFPQPPI